ncbi:MOSC domain-containing protein, partial [Geminicoccus flavidas]|uniref:MOSC domain-containing protein n=1 Tax=Geminicoccus flavidas TaxID=2506407 RepID=UPI002F42B0BE
MGRVIAVSRKAEHAFSKDRVAGIELITGEGVAGDAHRGRTVKHRSRVRIDPTQPNLRQVHLIELELIRELQAKGFRVGPGVMGENITTARLDLLAL